MRILENLGMGKDTVSGSREGASWRTGLREKIKLPGEPEESTWRQREPQNEGPPSNRREDEIWIPDVKPELGEIGVLGASGGKKQALGLGPGAAARMGRQEASTPGLGAPRAGAQGAAGSCRSKPLRPGHPRRYSPLRIGRRRRW